MNQNPTNPNTNKLEEPPASHRMKILKYAPLPPKVVGQDGDIKFIQQTIEASEPCQPPIQFYPENNQTKKRTGKIMKKKNK